MFLRIVNIYLISKHSHQRSKPFGIEINIDLEATTVKVKLQIYMVHFYPIWIEHWGIVEPDSLITPKESKANGVVMGWGKNRLKLA